MNKSAWALLLLLTGCSSVERSDHLEFSASVAAVVSQVSREVVASGAPIVVRFVDPVVNRAALAEAGDVASFAPGFAFDLSWRDDRTLEAMPRSPLESGRTYRATLDLSRIVGEDRAREPLEFVFVAIAPSVVSSSIELVPDGDGFRLAGDIVFSSTVPVDAVKRSATLTHGKRSFRLDVAGDPARADRVVVESAVIPRGEMDQEVIFAVGRRRTGLDYPYERHWVVPAAGGLSVLAVEPVDGDPRSGYRITLSDSLDPAQELSGLVRIEPSVPSRLRTQGREVYLLGTFDPGRSYSILVSGRLRSDEGVEQGEDRRFDIVTPDLEPQIEYLRSGVFMPSENRHTLGFRSVNLRRARVRVERVFENNLAQFLQTESLSSGRRRTFEFDYSSMYRVGVAIVDRTLEIGEIRNEWVTSGIDLADVFDGAPKGLYVVSLRFQEEDIIASPADYSFRYWESTIFKPVVETDIGITYKSGVGGDFVFAANLVDAKPMPGLRVALLSYQNQTIAEGLTDSSGFVSFGPVSGEVFTVTAEDSAERAVIKATEMGWNLSSFDTGGVEVSDSGVRAFVYTDRGVYRPGDDIHLSAVLRNDRQTFPDGHPISVKWYSPRGQLVRTWSTADGTDGFYSLTVATDPSDPTGEWRAEIEAGGTRFTHPVRVETIVPYRLKVRIEPESDLITRNDETFSFELTSEYLFGAPADGLDAEATVSLVHRVRTFPGFSGFTFDNESVRFASIRRQLFRGALDNSGRASMEWRLPPIESAPSALDLVVEGRVIEKGGRPNLKTTRIPVEPYDRYVGVRRPEMPYGYAQTGSDLSFSFVVVDPEGRALPGRAVTYRIYRNESYWWWEYDSRQDFRLHYRSDSHTLLLTEGRSVSGELPTAISFRPEEWGEYLMEVTDDSAGPAESGHTAGFFFRASFWGAAPSGADDASLLALSSDRDSYLVGETAIVTFPSPSEGIVLATIEHASGVLDRRIVTLEEGAATTSITFPLTADMVPNIYVALSLIQPHVQTANDRPLRLYGVVPIRVVDPESRIDVRISTKDLLEPNRPFAVSLETSEGAGTQLTVAVVDEGLLDITGYETPDPWNAFHAKQRLGVSTFDLYGHVIGANAGGFFQVYSVGGSYDQGLYTGGGEETERRFDPVALFAGPIVTDSSGRATVRFEMPNYLGSVRIMAVAAEGKSYGSAERTVPVRQDLVVLPSYPRVLGPGETFRVPVTLFALSDAVGRVTVSLDATGPATIEGDRLKSVSFTEAGEADLSFVVRTDEAVGTARFTLRAVSIRGSVVDETSVPVRASSPRISRRSDFLVESGGEVPVAIPGDGIPGTNQATVTVSRRPDGGIGLRVRELVTYPYGCIEQTVSAVFPQLFLRDLIESLPWLDDIDANVNGAIERLRKFQLASGAFSFWPGETVASIWGTNYAGHFLTEAKRLGFHVPEDMYSAWLRFETSRALSTSDGLLERSYRVYLLALSGEPPLAAMNLLYESNLTDMTDTMRLLLANAYLLRGMNEVASRVVSRSGAATTEYREYGPTYGSALRDKAMMLESMVLFGRRDEALSLYNEIALELASDEWYSTQTIGYALLAMGKFLDSEALSGFDGRLTGSIVLPDGERRSFDTDGVSVSVPVSSGFGGNVVVALDEASGLDRAYVTLDWEGIPLRSGGTPIVRNLSISASWYDENGRPMNPSNLVQGSSFWGVFRAAKSVSATVSDLALVFVTASGWEIENLRLTGETLPGFLQGRAVNEADYIDIRDDRVMWFFDLAGYESSREFVVKVNAVTAGTFFLPQLTFEAMYDNSYYASRPGMEVLVRDR